MLTTPIFRPWRPIWDAQLADATRRLDELAKERQKGRQAPPQVHDWSDVQRILLALHLARGRVSSIKFMREKIEPLLKACVWPRWLLLEAALDHAANAGDLHLSALILRSQIEELDALRTVATILLHREQISWDGDAMANAIQIVTERVLPRLQTKTDEQLIEQASDATTADTRPAPLQRAFDRLSEYVHPNYGSHILSVRPHDLEAAMVFIEAFVAIYEVFLALPWTKDADDSSEDQAEKRQTNSRDPYLLMADDTIPKLKLAFPAVGEEEWNKATESFRACASYENNWTALKGFPTDVEAIRALRTNSVPSDSWPEALRTFAGQNRYAFIVEQEHRLAQDASDLLPAPVQQDDKERLPVLLSAISFAINVTEYKLDLLARQATRLINAENVLGATLAVRSMVEHHAVAVELGEQLKALWERAKKGAPTSGQVSDALTQAEKQIARVLAGSSKSSQGASSWRTLWQEIVRKPYNVLGPIKALDAAQSGFVKIYGLLSHIIHGTVCTGGDLLGARGRVEAHQPTLAQLTLFLANLCEFNAMLDRQAGSILIAHRLDVIRRDPTALGERIKGMRLLEGQRLKPGRDIFGSGTHADPFRFRNGLLYHDAYDHYLKQEGIQVRNRRVEQLAGGFGDRVEVEDGRVLYFLNDKLKTDL
jgi:hypothetical protein